MISAPVITVAVTILTVIHWVVFRKAPGKSSVKPRKTRDELKDMKWESAGKVKKIIIYPLKSCRGTVVKSAKAEQLGMVDGTIRDRSFAVRSEKGNIITATMIPSMVLIQSVFENNVLTLKFPGVEELKVDISQVKENNRKIDLNFWGHAGSGLDCGEDSSNWLEMVLGRKCNLLYHADLPTTRTTELPNMEEHPLLRNDDHPLYANLTGYMLMTTKSIADLQSRVECKVDVDNFRPNILVDGTKEPYDEDDWEYIRIGDVVYRNVLPCERCSLTTINPETGKKDPNQEPLRTLKAYRCLRTENKPLFGIHLGLDLPGVVSEGDEVFITRSTHTKDF